MAKLFWMPTLRADGFIVSAFQWVLAPDGKLYAFRHQMEEPEYGISCRCLSAVANGAVPVGDSTEFGARRYFNEHAQPWPEDAINETTP